MRAVREGRRGDKTGVCNGAPRLIHKQRRPVETRATFEEVSRRLVVGAVGKDQRERAVAGKVLVLRREGHFDTWRRHHVEACRNVYERGAITRNAQEKMRPMVALGERLTRDLHAYIHFGATGAPQDSTRVQALIVGVHLGHEHAVVAVELAVDVEFRVIGQIPVRLAVVDHDRVEPEACCSEKPASVLGRHDVRGGARGRGVHGARWTRPSHRCHELAGQRGDGQRRTARPWHRPPHLHWAVLGYTLRGDVSAFRAGYGDPHRGHGAPHRRLHHTETRRELRKKKRKGGGPVNSKTNGLFTRRARAESEAMGEKWAIPHSQTAELAGLRTA